MEARARGNLSNILAQVKRLTSTSIRIWLKVWSSQAIVPTPGINNLVCQEDYSPVCPDPENYVGNICVTHESLSIENVNFKKEKKWECIKWNENAQLHNIE